MSRHRFTILVDIDDEELARQRAHGGAPQEAIEDWEGDDIVMAREAGIVMTIKVDWYGE